MNVSEAAYRFVSGGHGYTLRGELRLGRGELMARIEKAHGGSVKDSAAAFGVTTRTWQRWRTGEIKRLRSGHASALQLAVRRLRLSPGRERRLRAAGRLRGPVASLTVSGVQQVSNDEKKRGKARGEGLPGAPVGDWLKSGVDRIGPIVDAFLRGDDEAMTDHFQALLDDYVPGEWTDITEVTF